MSVQARRAERRVRRGVWRTGRAVRLVCSVGVVIACSGDRPTAPGAPTIVAVAVAPNALNTLSLAVTATVDGADSARVIAKRGDGHSVASRFAPVTRRPARITIFGLEETTAYRLVVEAVGRGGTVRSSPVEATTGELPAGLRLLRLTGTGQPTAGFTLTVPIASPADTLSYVVAFDTAGRVAWYRQFANEGWTVEAKQQLNGDITVYVGHSFGWQPAGGEFVELAPSGEIVRTFRARAAPYTDPHELRLGFRGTALTGAYLFGYRLERTDLSALGGARDAMIAVHVLERQDETGAPVFAWGAGTWYSPADWPATRGPPTDLVHPSAFAMDASGDYVVSFQAIDEIAKIDARTGAVQWRLGGRQNEFTILDDPLGGFRGQHSVQVLANGNLLLFDNRSGASPPTARAVEYALDVARRTARLVWEFRPSPAVVSPIMGSVQRLSNGSTVVGFGVPGRVMEVDAAGRVVWNATLAMNGRPTQFYRAIRIASLDAYSAP